MSNPKKKRITDFFTQITVSNSADVTVTMNGNPTVPIESENGIGLAAGLPNDENDQNDQNDVSDDDINDNVDKPKRKIVHKFRQSWLEEFKWLDYDNDTGVMSCKVCMQSNFKNTLTLECKNYRISTLKRHIQQSDHQKALKNQVLRKNLDIAVDTAFAKNTESIVAAMKCAYWLCQEGIATMKYGSLLSLMKSQGCSNIEQLGVGKNATYSSRETADEFQQTFAEIIQEDIDSLLKESTFKSILIDESTDLNVTKKLVIYGRCVMDHMELRSMFLGNVSIDNSRATAVIIHDCLKNFLNERALTASEISAFGSDGASVMTGRKGGVATLLRNESPHMINIHCMAHRLNLCTSKAAESVPFVCKVFQKTLVELFYYFKKSSCRVTELKDIQKILNDPQVKVKEVHEIRWFAMYNALNAVYKCWRSLVCYFKNIEKKTSKEVELHTNLTDYRFVYTMHVLMDVIPKFTELSLVFQKVNLDIACVQPAVDGCLSSLKEAKAGKTYFQALLKDQLKATKKDEEVQVKYWGEKLHDFNVKEGEGIRNTFIQTLDDKVRARFPSQCTSVATAFSVLGLRSLTFLTENEAEEYGRKEIQVLVDHYGEDKHGPNDVISKAIIDGNACVTEWSLVKKVIKKEMYPRDNFHTLWKLVHEHHSLMFPNLLTLARLALVMPLQTADCERGFSCQNDLLSPSRNRLSGATLNRLMLIKLQGLSVEKFDYNRAVQKWKSKKDRKFFK